MTRTVIEALWSHWRRHPLQLATLLGGLALATALWSGVQAINAEARQSYAEAAGVLGQDRLDRLVGARVTLEDHAALRRAGWLVSPVLEDRLRVGDTRLRLIGIDPLTAPPRAGLGALAAGEVALDAFLLPPGRLLVAPETAAALAGTDLPPRILAADLPPGVALTDITVAQRLLNRDDLSHLLIARDQPVGLPPLDSVTSLVRTAPETGGDLAQLTDSFHLNLTAFGLLSFAVGLFIVQSAIGLAFEQRRVTFRTLRALGVELPRLVSLLAAELAGFALLAGIAGLAMGYAIAAALLPGVAGTLRGLYGAQISGELGFDPLWALSGLAITALGTAAAGAQALWRVAHLPLLAPAMPRAWARASARTMAVSGLSGLGLLLAAALLGARGASLVAGFACLAALLIGAALLLPPVLAGLLWLAERVARGVRGEWLLADARQQLPSLSLALMALLLALSANVGVGTMVGSFRATFTGWLDQRLAAELYVTARDAAEAAEMRPWLEERSEAVLPIWSVEGRLGTQPADIFGAVDHETYRDNWPLLDRLDDPWDRLQEGDAVLVNEQFARRAGIPVGARIEVLPGWRPEIAGIYSDYGNPRAQAIAGFDALRARLPESPVLRFALRLPEAQIDAVSRALRDRFGLPASAVIDQAEAKRFSLEVFDRTFLVTRALNVLTLGVAGFAILTALLTLADMRIPALAPVWALGFTPRALATAETARTLILAVLTWALSVPVGLVLAWVLLAVVNVHAFGWRLPMTVFPRDWIELGGWAMLAALLASAWPAWRLVRLPPRRLLARLSHDR